MMRTILHLIKILYKKKWWLTIAPVVAALLVYIILSHQPKQYQSSTTIYTGIVSGYDIFSESAGHQDWLTITNAIDNLLSIIKAESTLENVSMRLLARNLVNLDIENDNEFLRAESSRELMKDTPSDVFALVVKGDENETYDNLKTYYHKDRTNYLQQLFHWNHRHYSYGALSEVVVERVGSSDMISISYENDDQYIVYNTLNIVVEEFIKQYIILRYEQTNDVVGYFERELEKVHRELTTKENTLMNFSTQHQIINYEQQTKMVVDRTYDIEKDIEEVSRELISATRRLAILEERLGEVSKMYRSNAQFIEKLHDISSLYAESTRIIDENQHIKVDSEIQNATKDLHSISSDIAITRYSKDGVAIKSLIEEWLNDLLLQTKANAELSVLLQDKSNLNDIYERYSPIGTSIARQNRDISFSERSYLSYLEALNEARLRQKNLQLTSATFKILTPPTVALTPVKTKNTIYTIITLILVFVLLVVSQIIGEILNRKPYDKAKAEKVIGIPAIGAYPMVGKSEEDKICAEFAQSQLGNAIVNFFDRTKTCNIINVMSMNEEDGKSTVCEALMEYFRKLDTNPVYISHHKDFDADSKYFLLAGSVYDFAINENNMDDVPQANVIIVEYPPLSKISFPTKLLAGAINLLVVDTEANWKGMDHILLKQLQGHDKEAKIYTCLNGADKDAVGTFTGMLPPYSFSHRIRFTMWNLGNSNL